MKDFLSRVAARATGTAPLLRPAATSRHAPTTRELQQPPLAEHEAVVAASEPAAAPEAQVRAPSPVSSPAARAGHEAPSQRPPGHAREEIAPARARAVPGEVAAPREPPWAPAAERPAAVRVPAVSTPLEPETIAATAEPTPPPRSTVREPARPRDRGQRPASAPAASAPAAAPAARPPAAVPAASAPAASAPAAARPASEAGAALPTRPASTRVAQRAAEPPPSRAFPAAASQAEPPVVPELVVADHQPAGDDDALGALDALAARAEAGVIGSFAPLPRGLPRGSARDGGARAARAAPEAPSEVRISIGRLEVHAPPAAAPEPEPRARRGPRLALQDYLGRHRDRRG